MTMRFKEQVALITAAASGIGRATAEIIGAEGGTVVGVDTDKSRIEEAMDAVRRAESELAAQEPCPPCSMPFLLAASIACARAGELGEGDRFLNHADRVAAMWQGGPWLAGVWEARAELRLAGGEPLQAAALFREAADLFSRSGHSLSEERCLAAAARMERGPRGAEAPRAK
jgi:NAD(P)-dependent dehydrogenase (short-subunit alcohol dehydrogenase family)